MAKKATLTPVTDTALNAGAINTQLNAINNKLDNTLSLDGSTPNAMNADVDMNSNDILNAGSIQAADIIVAGGTINGVLAAAQTSADDSANSATASSNSATASSNSATASSNSATQAAQYDGIWLDDVATLLADTTLTYTAGQPSTVVVGDYVRTRKEGFAYQVAASGDVTTAGSIQLDVMASDGGYNVKAFGAVGDGVTNDTTAIQTALTASDNVFMPLGTYLVSGTLTVGNKTLDGSGSTLNVSGTSQIFTVAGGCVKNLTIDGQGNAHTAYPSEILSSTGSRIINVNYQNIVGVIANFQTYCIKLPMWNAFDFEISSVSFKDITQQDDGAVTGQGFVGGIYFTSGSLGTQANVTRGVVRDIYAENIKSIDAGSGVVQDSDLIRSYYDNVDDLSALNWPIAFENITAKNVGKRVFKIGSMNGGSITNVNCIKDDGAAENMYSAITINADRWVIDRVKIDGEVERGIDLNGDAIVVSDVVYSTTSTTGTEFAILLGSGVGVATKCVVSNVTSSQARTAIYFYDAFDCRVSNVFARGTTNSLVVDTANTSTGNINTITCVTSEDAGVRIDGGAFLNIFDLNIQEHTLTSYPFSLVDGQVRARGVYIYSSTGRRIMNIAPLAGQSVDLDDITLVRASDAVSYSTNNYPIFTTIDANAASFLRIGTMRVVSNHNPVGSAVSNSGRAHFTIASLNYTIDTLTVVNNFARNQVGQDVYISSGAGDCRINTLIERQDIAGGNMVITAPTAGKLVIHTLELDNGFASGIGAYIGTVFSRGGTVSGALNTPTTITV